MNVFYHDMDGEGVLQNYYCMCPVCDGRGAPYCCGVTVSHQFLILMMEARFLVAHLLNRITVLFNKCVALKTFQLDTEL